MMYKTILTELDFNVTKKNSIFEKKNLLEMDRTRTNMNEPILDPSSLNT